MTKQITAINLGYSINCPVTFHLPQGSLILECVYSKNNGVMVHYLLKDPAAPTVPRTFVFYSAYNVTPALENRKRYWYIGTAYQRYEPTTTITNGSYYVPDDIVYFVFEVE